MIKRILRALLTVLMCVIILAMLFILTLTLTEYRPADTAPAKVSGTSSLKPAVGGTLRIVSWNIGYGALGDTADFFMDGGTQVKTANREEILSNLDSIRGWLAKENPDICLLQEVDKKSDRSESVDETARIGEGMDGYSTAFAYNFNSLYVPYPLPPIGHVESGLFTLSRFGVSEAVRRSLPCPFSWPIRTVNLKRCLLVTRIPVEGTDRELVVVNLHLEAYDDGAGKRAQTEALAGFLLQEVEKGNYVIAGGDFNQMLAGTDAVTWTVQEGLWKVGMISQEDFDPRFSLLMDFQTPSCRSLYKPYRGADKESFQYYPLDGFIVSDNLAVESLETVSLDFVWSDHNPVALSVRLLD